MKMITQLPPGDWSMIVWGDCILVVCPQQEPRLINTETGTVTVIDSNKLSFIVEHKE